MNTKAKTIFERDNYTCIYCGQKFDATQLTIEHKRPKFLGGTNKMENLATACRMCNVEKAAKDYDEYVAELISKNPDYFESFVMSLSNIRSLVEIDSKQAVLNTILYRLLYVNIVAALETYLSDAFAHTVLNSKAYLRKFVEANPEFCARRLPMSDIYKRMDGIEQEVQDYLLEIIYHNIAKIKPMYQDTLGVDFPDDLREIFKAILTRHDIVHRNGKSKDGKAVIIAKKDVLELCEVVEELVQYIDNQIKARV